MINEQDRSNQNLGGRPPAAQDSCQGNVNILALRLDKRNVLLLDEAGS